jgi:hypothetical protein
LLLTWGTCRAVRHEGGSNTTLRRWVLPLRRWVLPFVVRSYPSSLGRTLRRWAVPFVVGFYPSSLGRTLRCWVLPFVVGSYPSLLGPTCHRWVVPVVVGSYPSSLVGFTPSPFGFTLRCLVLPPEGRCVHLRVVRHEGSRCDRRWVRIPHVGRCEGGVVAVSWSCHRGGPSIFVVGAIAVVVDIVVGGGLQTSVGD